MIEFVKNTIFMSIGCLFLNYKLNFNTFFHVFLFCFHFYFCISHRFFNVLFKLKI